MVYFLGTSNDYYFSICVLISKNSKCDHFNNAVQNYWWMFALSFICFVVAGILNFIKKYHGLSFIMVILQMAFAFMDTELANYLTCYIHISK